MDCADDPWRWRHGRLLRGLSTERSCSADMFTECWLIGQPDLQKKTLRVTKLVLTGFEPGKLRVRFCDHGNDYRTRYNDEGDENDIAFLMAWLLRQHHSIREVRGDRTQFGRVFMSVIAGPAPNLQRVVLDRRYRLQRETGFPQAFGPPPSLRSLDLAKVRVSDALAPRMAEVLTGNGSTLHSVKLLGNQLCSESTRNLLLTLGACEQLEDDVLGRTRSPACDAMAEAFRSGRVIQKLSLEELG